MKTTFTHKLIAIIAGLFIATRLLAQGQQAITIHVEEPGTLSSYIADSKKDMITNLVLTGNIDGGDIIYLRGMDSLITLDLSQITFIGGHYGFNVDDDLSYEVFRDNDCEALTKIIVPNSIKELSSRSFDCKKLESIIVNEENPYFSDINGILFNKDQTELISCPRNFQATEYTVPESVLSISSGAFGDNANLISIDLPYNVQKIGSSAFYSCDELKEVTMSNTVTEIGGSTFDYCIKLDNVHLSNNIKTIEHYTFRNCKSLQSIVIPEGVESLGLSVFYDCESLISVTLPSTLKSAGRSILGECDKLKAIYCYATIPPSIEDKISDLETYAKATLYVPKSTYNAYWLAKVWGDFKNIVEMEEGATTANESITTNQDFNLNLSSNGIYIETQEPTEVYICTIKGQTVSHKSINGNETIQLPQGFYIVKVGNQTKKVIIK